METAMESAPVVSTVTESSQESKVEKVPNGTVESSVSTEKTVSQSVQVQGDQSVQQKSVVEEVKQQSFSSSSVVMSAPETVQAPAPVQSQEVVVKQEVVKQAEVAPVAAPQVQPEVPVPVEEISKPEVAPEVVQPVQPETKTEAAPPVQAVILPAPVPVEKAPEPVEKVETPVEKVPAPAEKAPEQVSLPEKSAEQVSIVEKPLEPVELAEKTQDPALSQEKDSETASPVAKAPQKEATQEKPVENGAAPEKAPESKQEPVAVPEIPKEVPPAPEKASKQASALAQALEQVASLEKALEEALAAKNAPSHFVAKVPEPVLSFQNENAVQSRIFVGSNQQGHDEADGSVTTGDGLEIPLNESILPPVAAPQPAADVNSVPYNNFVINEAKPQAPEITANKEIQQESIKKQLNEIITDIEKNVTIGGDEPASDEKLDGKKPVDLQKIFTPATDVDEILPGTNRKLFASSSFYSPSIHPTVEDQVELARRISHSLSDSTNHTSKGQSMYVNRKKRSVKWIHDDGHEEERFIEEHQETKENGHESSSYQQQHTVQQSPQAPQQNGAEYEAKRVPLKLLMDPRHVQDLNSMRNQPGYEANAPMSPEFGYELVNALNATKGRGAELFAKRRKKAEKWVVDGPSSAHQTPGATPTPGSAMAAYSDVGTQHVHRSMHQDQVQEKYLQPSVKMVKSPWEAALETGSANNAFTSYDQQQNQIYSASAGQVQQFDYGSTTSSSLYSSTKKDVQYQSSQQIRDALTGRDLAYRPNVPQGWNRPPVVLPAEFSVTESSVDDDVYENEMSEIYTSQQNYLELIRRDTPTPPVVEYAGRAGEVETNVYEEPVQELIIPSESRESTPDYQAVPVKDLISTFEQGIYTPAEIPILSSTTSSITTEKISKFSSTTSSTSGFNDVAFPQQSAPLTFSQSPTPFAQPAVQKPVQQAQPKPYQSAPASFIPKPQQQPAYQPPQQPAYQQPQQQAYQAPPQAAYQPPPAATPAPIKVQIPSPRHDAPLSRSGVNASPVTPGILKMQIRLDAAVPVPPGGNVPSSSPIPAGARSVGKSPVPFYNTAPAPFGFPAMSVQTPETIAQVAPAATPLVPHLQNPKPLPLIFSTPMPSYSSSYNTAARPFNEFKDYYKSINMDSVNHKMIPPVIYTDF